MKTITPLILSFITLTLVAIAPTIQAVVPLPDGGYPEINAMLLNEFLKEHRRGEEQDFKIQEQETTIAELRSEIRNLAATVSEQASQLQKVSAQLQIGNAAAQSIASNSP
jgi:hypothetical protein